MVTSLNNALPARDNSNQDHHSFRKTVTVLGGIFRVGGLPANAMIRDVIVRTTTAFDATSTSISVGWLDSTGSSPANYIAAAAAPALGAVLTFVAGISSSSTLPLTRDTVVTCTVTVTGASAGTVGAADVIVDYISTE